VISAVGSISGMSPAIAAPSAAPTSAPSAPPAIARGDTASISAAGEAFCKAELLGMALILALMSSDKDKKKESSLVAALAITAVMLQDIAKQSPFIVTSIEGGERMYALTGSIQAPTAGTIGSFFTGGIAAVAGVML